jgi:hypothetical protein
VRARLLVLVFVGGGLVLAFPFSSLGQSSSVGTWSGTWERGEIPGKTMTLVQNGSTVSGSYNWNDASGHIGGTASGATLSGGFNETHYEGGFTLTMVGPSEACPSGTHHPCFTGSYTGKNRDTGGAISGSFTGSCVAGDCLSNGTVVVPTPSAYDQTVTAADPPPGGTAIIDSPALAGLGAITVNVGGFSQDDLFVLAALRRLCYVNFVRRLVVLIGGAFNKTDENFAANVPVLLLFAQARLDYCVAAVDAIEAEGPAPPAADIARASCPTTGFALSTTGSGANTRLRSIRLAGLKSLQVSCARHAGSLRLTLATSGHTKLSRIFGSTLQLAIARSRHDPVSGRLSVRFHHS